MDREHGRRRRRYSAEFKADLIATCQQPGVSIASIALANGMNANVLRRWLVEYRQSQVSIVGSGSATSLAEKREPSFVPVRLDAPAPADIRVELRRAATTVTVTWPVTAASECAAWMRELLK